MSPVRRLRRPTQFGVRDLFLLLAIVALVLGWWLDRTRMVANLERSQVVVQSLHLENKLINDNWRRGLPHPDSQPGYPQGWPTIDNAVCSTPEEFVAFLSSASESDFDDEAMRFVQTSMADEAISTVVGLLRDSDPTVRARAGITLGKMACAWRENHCPDSKRPDSMVPLLISALKDDDDEVRGRVLDVLECLGPSARAAVPAIKAIAHGNSDPLAVMAVTSLQAIVPDEKTKCRLVELLRSTDASTRDLAAFQIWQRRWPNSKRILVDALRQETDSGVRYRLRRAVADLELGENDTHDGISP